MSSRKKLLIGGPNESVSEGGNKRPKVCPNLSSCCYVTIREINFLINVFILYLLPNLNYKSLQELFVVYNLEKELFGSQHICGELELYSYVNFHYLFPKN